MSNVKVFTFNAFQENTYLLWSNNGDCWIIDPGCSSTGEENILKKFIDDRGLHPVRLINTHCHIDHILGNEYVSRTFDLKLEAHKNEKDILRSGKVVADMYGLPYSPSPTIEHFLEEGDELALGETIFQVLLTPGHSPGSICLYTPSKGMVIGGDVLFYGSIGRTDLPGGNYETLIRSIKEKLLVLPDETIIMPGHGPNTNIGFERTNNPFLNQRL